MGYLSKLKDYLKISALLIVCIGIPLIAWALVRIVRGSPDATVKDPTYAELVAIILTAVTVVLAVLAIIVAILAFFGYRDIKNQAAIAAQRTIEETVATALKKTVNESSLQRLLAQHVEKILKHTPPENAYSQAYFDPDSAAPAEKIAIEYPKEGEGKI